MKANQILVIGGTGKTGRRVVERLHAAGLLNTRIGSRNAKPSFDWTDSSTWEKALEGIDAVYITFQPDLAVAVAPDIIQQFTNLAVNMGIKKMVLLSGRGEEQAQVCEEIVKRTALNWTIVRASWFFQNFSESFFLEPILSGHVALPRADMPEPFIDADDIADVVVKCLLEDQHHGKTYSLTGPELLTFRKVITEISRITNRTITFEELTVEEYVSALRLHHVPEDYIRLIKLLFDEVLDGRNSSTTSDVEQILGRKATTFATYVRAMAEAGIWNVPSYTTIQ